MSSQRTSAHDWPVQRHALPNMPHHSGVVAAVQGRNAQLASHHRGSQEALQFGSHTCRVLLYPQ
jgi:hypothetical protein